MAIASEEITLTSGQEAIVAAFLKKYPESSRFTALKFCFGRKFDLNRVFPLYEEYQKIVQERKLQNITAAQVLHELRTQKMYIPGSRDKKGAALFIVKASRHVIGQFPAESTIKLAYYLGECVTASLKTQRNGLTLIIDLAGTEWSNFDANFMAEIIGFFQNHIPAAVKNILIWRAPWWIRTAIKIVSPFLKEKMRKRIKLCDNLHSLLEYVSESDLPVEFGGSFEYDHDYFIRKELSKTSSHDVFAALTTSIELSEFSDGKTLEMVGSICALSPTLEEALQKEREEVLIELDDQIEFLIQHPEANDNVYPVPIYDLMQNKIYRLTLDVTADYRPFKDSSEISTSDPLHKAWKQAQQVNDDWERIKIMRDALYLDKKEFLLKSKY
jgi:hypothetical protein